MTAGASNGGYDSIADASAAMARPHIRTYRPDPAAAAVYDELYGEYMTLHDYFGRGANDVMKTLKRLRVRALSGPAMAPQPVRAGGSHALES